MIDFSQFNDIIAKLNHNTQSGEPIKKAHRFLFTISAFSI